MQLVTGLGAKPAQAIPTPYFDWRYSGKLDHHFNEKHTLSVSYNNQNNRGQNDQSGSQNDLTEGNSTTNQLILANATLTSVLSPKAMNAFTAGYQYWNNLIDSQLRVPYVDFPSGVSFGTNVNVPQQSFQKKWQFKDDFSYTFGKHSIKTGFDYLYEPVLGGFFENNPTLEVDFLADPSVITANAALYPQGFATPGLVGGMTITAGDPYFLLSAKMFGLYFQDDWKASSRLSVNLGLRWDRDFNLNGASQQTLSRTYLELKAINSPYAGLPKDDRKDFSPRVGLAYDLTGNGKHILRAGAGIYYGQIFENIPLFMIQQANPTIFTNVFSISSSGPSDAKADIVPGTSILLSKWRYGVDPYPTAPPPPTELPAGSTGRLMVPDYHNPYTEQLNVGYSWQLNSASVVEVEYVHSLGLRESKTVELNPKDPNNGGKRILASAFNAAGVPALRGISAEFSTGRSRYDGLNFSYRRRMSRRFSINTNFVLSRSLAYEGSAAAFRNRPTDPYHVFAAHDFGPTPSDETHRVVFSGLLDLPWGFKVSPMVQWASARPYNTQEGIDYYGYGRNNENAIVPVSNANDYATYSTATAVDIRACLASNQCKQTTFDALRGQPFFQFDARVAKTIKIKERATIDVFFQAFDITNRANFGADYNGNVRSSTFRTPTGFITPSGVITPRSFSGEFGTTFRF